MTTGQEQTWAVVEQRGGGLVAAVGRRFSASKHHLIATLRADGSPRVSGTEVQFHGRDLTVGMMHRSLKARDLLRDGRFALHATIDDSMGSDTESPGDVKVAGIALEVTDPTALAAYVAEIDPPQPFHLFRLLLNEVVRTSLHPAGDRLLIERWTPAGGLVRVERA